jgi:RimJ/RimL family protein N-acetyltransferase
MRVRRATEKDLLDYYELVNDDLVRLASFSSSAVTLDEHARWFENSLANKNRIMYVLEGIDNETAFLGQVRFDEVSSTAFDNTFELDYSIAPSQRGKGLGNKMLLLGLKMLAENFQNPHVIAKVKLDNFASAKALLKAGFLWQSKIKDMDIYIMNYGSK